MQLLEEIDAETYATKTQELRGWEAELKTQIDSTDRNRHEIIDTATKAFELSQDLRAKWLQWIGLQNAESTKSCVRTGSSAL